MSSRFFTTLRRTTIAADSPRAAALAQPATANFADIAAQPAFEFTFPEFTIPGFTIPQPTAPSPPATPSAPGVSFSQAQADIVAAVNAIPIAVDGQVITVEYHNAVRTAIQAIASQMGFGAVANTDTITFPPLLLPSGVAPGTAAPRAWTVDETGAQIANAVPQELRVWMPIKLPHFSRLQSMTVFGSKQGTAGTFSASLFRYPLDSDGANIQPMLTIDMKDKIGDIEESRSITAGTSSAVATNAALTLQAEEQKLINNDIYRYVVVVRLQSADANLRCRVNGLRFVVIAS
jgi:hypothetical protein